MRTIDHLHKFIYIVKGGVVLQILVELILEIRNIVMRSLFLIEVLTSLVFIYISTGRSRKLRPLPNG